MSPTLPEIKADVPLAPLTTLGVGGPARHFAVAQTEADLVALTAHAHGLGWPTFVLGGGSNLLVADRGFDGLVIQLSDCSFSLEPQADGSVQATVGGAMRWDAFVERTVAAGLAGVECLSGIPGTVGAAPIQNIGAYGQEVSETVHTVHAVERATGRLHVLTHDECGFGYRDSVFKGRWADQMIVSRVAFRLRPGGAPTIRYGELRAQFAPDDPPTLAEVRETVLRIRRRKSMVWDETDPNHRSAGSFFTNPMVSEAEAAEVERRAAEHAGSPVAVPRYPAGDGRVKLAAAWLIEQSGFSKGYRLGAAGLSTAHTLALINPDGRATAADLVRLAAHIRRTVRDRFGVTLDPEPVFLGFDRPTAVLLDQAETQPC